jgi:hypothetical protein
LCPLSHPLKLTLTQDGADTLCRQLVDDSSLTPRLKALRARELARGLDPELLRRFVLYVRRYRYPVSGAAVLLAAAGGSTDSIVILLL